jgi:hypothetical protein
MTAQSSCSVFVIVLASCGCLPNAPPLLQGGADGGASFADAVVSYPAGGLEMACATSLACADAEPSCGAVDAVLGPNDGVTYPLGVGGQIVIAFRCSFIVSHGDQLDFKIWSTVPAGSTAAVEVSADGSQYLAIDSLATSDQTFSLARIDVPEARFVRLTNVGAADIAIDAVLAP